MTKAACDPPRRLEPSPEWPRLAGLAFVLWAVLVFVLVATTILAIEITVAGLARLGVRCGSDEARGRIYSRMMAVLAGASRNDLTA